MPGWRECGLNNHGGEVAAPSLLGTEEGLALGSRTWGGLRPAQAGGLLEPSSSIFIPKKEGQKKKKRGAETREAALHPVVHVSLEPQHCRSSEDQTCPSPTELGPELESSHRLGQGPLPLPRAPKRPGDMFSLGKAKEKRTHE